MAWKYDSKKGYWMDSLTGEILHTPPTNSHTAFSQTTFNVKPAIQKALSKGKDDKDDKACPTHKEAILVLTKKVNVWAGSANKTDTFPAKALIVDLANRYGNGLRAEGLELPEVLRQKRLIFDWPDMSKPYLFKKEWQALTDWLLTLETVKAHGLYIACLEGHGRTGTALAILAHFWDEWNDNVDVVRMIRKKYCPRSVETSSQIEYFESMTGRKTKCVGSNGGGYTGGMTSYTPTPCYLTVQGSLVDCQHTCSAKTVGHKEHWCDLCKWDWWVDKDGLWEKPSPGNKAEHREKICTPGEHKVEKLNKDGKVVVTETWSQDNAKDSITAFDACWDDSPVALGSNGNCEGAVDSHLCGVEKNHPGRHVCVMCDGVWDREHGPTAGLVDLDVDEANPKCLAKGGVGADHICECNETTYAEYMHMHICNVCSMNFTGEDDDT